MSLKERIKVTSEGFTVASEGDSSRKKVYYNSFDLRSDEIEKNYNHPVAYWDPYQAYTQRIEKGKFVCVWEEDEQGNREEFLFYNNAGSALPRLEIRFEQAKKYGERAYMITIEAKDNQFEPIHRKHIWLKHKKSGRCFKFLKEIIMPLDSSDKVKKDQYIINLPMEMEIEQVTIETDELLRQKYMVVHH